MGGNLTISQKRGFAVGGLGGEALEEEVQLIDRAALTGQHRWNKRLKLKNKRISKTLGVTQT